MRQLATLPSADAARTFADYLLTLRIDTKLEQQPDGWALWVCDEDQLARARAELEAYTQNPADPRYAAAGRAAADLRRQRRVEDDAYERRQRRFYRRMGGPLAAAPATVGLIVACALVSLLTQGGTSYRLVRLLTIAPFVPVEQNRLLTPGLESVREGEVWRLVTPAFLHFGIWHLVFDMYMLYRLGGPVEKRRGLPRYLALVLVLAVLSNLAEYFFGHPTYEGSELHWPRWPLFGGMSGVVYGLFGYTWMKALYQPQLDLHVQPSTVLFLIAWLMLCMTPVMDVVIGSGVANGAHLGGLAAGMVLGYVPTLWARPGGD